MVSAGLDLPAPHATMQAMKALIRPWPLAIALLAVCALPAHAQIKRWVDERGVVHYSNSAPQPGDKVASPVTEVAPAQPLSPADQALGQARLEQYRQDLAKPAASAAPVAAAPGMKPPAAPVDQSCAGQWQRYNAAYACLDPYRAQGGAIKAEGFSKCPVVKQPECPAPNSQ